MLTKRKRQLSKKVIKVKGREKAVSWVTRFVRFNLIGFIVFLIGTAIFTLVFPYFGEWAWVVANSTGGVLQFSLITYFNKKNNGLMFKECPKVYDEDYQI